MAEINAVDLDCKLKELKEKFENELDSVMKFWLENSHDASHGYVCIYILEIHACSNPSPFQPKQMIS